MGLKTEKDDRGRTGDTLVGVGSRGSGATTMHDGTSEPVREATGPITSLGRYGIIGPLGQGGMGKVYEARDPELRRNVAVKVLLHPRHVGPKVLARFVVEARITSQLEHPNIIPVYDMGITDDGMVYFVMRKVSGQSLREVIDGQRDGEPDKWSLRRLLTAFAQICNAVAYANARGILHRDIKPENIMFGRFGEVLLLDWGASRLIGYEHDMPNEEKIDAISDAHRIEQRTIGTPGYMSPEQAIGDLYKLDGRSDVWSLGAVLYEVLTLEPAYDGRDAYALVVATLDGPPIDPRDKAPKRGIPDELSDICQRCLARDRHDRFHSAADLAHAIEEFLELT